MFQFQGTGRDRHAGLGQLDSAPSEWLIFNTLWCTGGIHGVNGDRDPLGLEGNQVDLSDYRVNRAGSVIHSAVHMARHEATYDSTSNATLQNKA
jgi:hypothetical protein